MMNQNSFDTITCLNNAYSIEPIMKNRIGGNAVNGQEQA